MQPFYWAQGGNPVWLKVLMVLGIITALRLIIRTLREMNRTYRQAQLRELQDRLADEYAARFNYKGRQPHGQKKR